MSCETRTVLVAGPRVLQCVRVWWRARRQWKARGLREGSARDTDPASWESSLPAPLSASQAILGGAIALALPLSPLQSLASVYIEPKWRHPCSLSRAVLNEPNWPELVFAKGILPVALETPVRVTACRVAKVWQEGCGPRGLRGCATEVPPRCHVEDPNH